MSVLNSEMKRLVERQRLGFVATVCPDEPEGQTRLSAAPSLRVRLILPTNRGHLD